MTEMNYLAKIGDKEITAQDVEFAINSLDPYQKQQFANEEGRKRILADLINQELFYLDAKENKLDEEENFKKEMELVKINMIKQYAINKVLAGITITEDEKKKYYEENQDQFKKEETVHAKHILVDDESKAKEIAEKISNNEISFEDAAKEYSSCPSNMNGGDLGEFSKGQMVPEFEKAAFEQKVGEVSEPVKTQFGYHLIKVENHSKASQLNYDEVQKDINDALSYNKQNEAFMSKLNELTEKYKDILVINKGE